MLLLVTVSLLTDRKARLVYISLLNIEYGLSTKIKQD